MSLCRNSPWQCRQHRSSGVILNIVLTAPTITRTLSHYRQPYPLSARRRPPPNCTTKHQRLLSTTLAQVQRQSAIPSTAAPRVEFDVVQRSDRRPNHVDMGASGQLSCSSGKLNWRAGWELQEGFPRAGAALSSLEKGWEFDGCAIAMGLDVDAEIIGQGYSVVSLYGRMFSQV